MAVYQMEEHINLIRKSTNKGLQRKYFDVMQLLDDIGPWSPRLNLVHKMVSAPDFLYNEHINPSPFLYMVLHSAYWLDRELFDTRVVRQRYCRSNLTEEQKVHIKLLDIGCILMEKGFPLEQVAQKNTGNNKFIDTWAHVFFDQCKERQAFLKQYRCTHQRPPRKASNGHERS